MKLFWYFATRSLKNSLRKIFKTWVAIVFAIILVVGIIAGSLGAAFDKKAEREAKQGSPTADITTVEQPGTAAEGAADDHNSASQIVTAEENDNTPQFVRESGLTKIDFIGIIIAAIILMLLMLDTLTGKSGANVFKPADTALLFGSPLKPQTVMMFRICNNMGAQVFASVFYLFQIPNLVLNAGLTIWAAFTVLLAWLVLLIICSVIPVLIFTVTTRFEWLGKHLQKFFYALFALILLGFVIYAKNNSGTLLRLIFDYFASERAYWVPFYGWLIGLCMSAIKADLAMTLLFFGLNILGIIILLVIIWNIDADFYEEALSNTEKTAEAVAAAQSTGVVQRKKERSDKIKRDGFNHGFGANVYIYKTLYNRFRFGKASIFTKTMIMYIVVVGLACYFLRDNTSGYLIVMAILGALAFLRAIGNPLQEDASKTFFAMIPEPAGKKLFYSLLGGMVNTVLDVLIPLIGAFIFFTPKLGTALVCILTIFSIDFMSSTIGAFIGISVPGEGTQNFKVLVQVLFIYFGLMPSVGFIVAGFLLEKEILFILIAACFNLLIGGIFFSLMPRYLENGNR